MVDVDTVRESRSWFLGLGLAFAVLGVLAIILPFIASLVTTIVIGWLMLLGGLFQGYHAIRNRRWAGSGWAIASAAIQVIAGVLVILFPLAGTLSLTLILAAYLAAEGAFKIIRAIQHRRMPARGWLVFDGILSLALAILILAIWPGAAVWVLGLIVGVNLLFGGISMLLIGLGAGPVLPARP
ncbi:Hypothetical protein A7982_03963 [Minicystis rosea]|nr:Hypothetical protein A7982_03963 [Minicystis rosea]